MVFEQGSAEFRDAIEVLIKDLMEVHAPVDLSKQCHHHH